MTTTKTSQPVPVLMPDSAAVVKEYRAARLAVRKARERQDAADAALRAFVQGWLDASGLTMDEVAMALDGECWPF